MNYSDVDLKKGQSCKGLRSFQRLFTVRTMKNMIIEQKISEKFSQNDHLSSPYIIYNTYREYLLCFVLSICRN